MYFLKLINNIVSIPTDENDGLASEDVEDASWHGAGDQRFRDADVTASFLLWKRSASQIKLRFLQIKLTVTVYIRITGFWTGSIATKHGEHSRLVSILGSQHLTIHLYTTFNVSTDQIMPWSLSTDCSEAASENFMSLLTWIVSCS